MPTVNLNKKTVLKYIGKKVTDEVLLEKIPMLGTDLEQITDDEIVVEIFPNRPDMLSEEGFSRAFSAFMGIKPGF
ncbi:MAG: phenylalanine--tRNA ligase subunit beta, partial [Candidatus Aenigmarchaeota archaeon]|nr:phenylalanine--tRNA ligase subunit beta [Candidatus Aenigmarchaeota archaeon]